MILRSNNKSLHPRNSLISGEQSAFAFSIEYTGHKMEYRMLRRKPLPLSSIQHF